MGVTTSNKELSTETIKCGGSFNIKLSLAAEPDIVSHPTDIVLVLDRSRSMAGSPLANLKSGAKRFIQIIDESTDGEHIWSTVGVSSNIIQACLKALVDSIDYMLTYYVDAQTVPSPAM